MPFDSTRPLTRENFGELPSLCTDGAWGTELAARGAEPGELVDLWNVDHADRVEAVARAYVDAGAQIILTNTFSCGRSMLERHGLADRSGELCRAGATISKKAAASRAYVFGSIGPCGKMVMMGEIGADEVKDSAAEQAAALAEGGADAIVVETQSDLAEAEASLKGALRGCVLPVGISFTFDAGANNDRTMMGATIPEAYALAQDVGAQFVGANCGAGIESFVAIAEAYAACGSGLPIWVKGNAGLPELGADGNAVYRGTPGSFEAVVPKLLSAGARFVGGCCGSSPAHIHAMAGALAKAAD
jgi:5-methyltetrahydrofolate--homocysteine methyltransferase